MKLKRILTLPFAFAADALTLGNFGDRSFTQQVFDAERIEQENKAVVDLLTAIGKAVKEEKK